MTPRSHCYEGPVRDGWIPSDDTRVLNAYRIERWGPLVFALLLSVAVYWLEYTIPVLFARELLSAIISVSAIGAGFLTTALSILMTVGSTATGKQLKRRKKLTTLFEYLRRAILSCLCVVVVCVAAFFCLDPESGIGSTTSTVIAFASTLCLGHMVRIVEILVHVVNSESETTESAE